VHREIINLVLQFLSLTLPSQIGDDMALKNLILTWFLLWSNISLMMSENPDDSRGTTMWELQREILSLKATVAEQSTNICNLEMDVMKMSLKMQNISAKIKG